MDTMNNLIKCLKQIANELHDSADRLRQAVDSITVVKELSASEVEKYVFEELKPEDGDKN